MHNGKYVFSQLLDFLDRFDFIRLAKKYGGDKYVKQFTCYNQLCVLMFGQLSNRESLRDVVLATQVHASKAYHLGFGKAATKSNLSKANNNRDYRISRSSPTRWSLKREPAARKTSSNLEETYMPLIQRLSSSVSRHSNGLCSGRIKEKEASRCIRCMTSRLPFRHSSTSPKPEYTTRKRWMRYLTRKTRSTSSIEATMTSNDFTTFRVSERTSWFVERRTTTSVR